jgi:hypothetical protein
VAAVAAVVAATLPVINLVIADDIAAPTIDLTTDAPNNNPNAATNPVITVGDVNTDFIVSVST